MLRKARPIWRREQAAATAEGINRSTIRGARDLRRLRQDRQKRLRAAENATRAMAAAPVPARTPAASPAAAPAASQPVSRPAPSAPSPTAPAPQASAAANQDRRRRPAQGHPGPSSARRPCCGSPWAAWATTPSGPGDGPTTARATTRGSCRSGGKSFPRRSGSKRSPGRKGLRRPRAERGKPQTVPLPGSTRPEDPTRPLKCALPPRRGVVRRRSWSGLQRRRTTVPVTLALHTMPCARSHRPLALLRRDGRPIQSADNGAGHGRMMRKEKGKYED